MWRAGDGGGGDSAPGVDGVASIDDGTGGYARAAAAAAVAETMASADDGGW